MIDSHMHSCYSMDSETPSDDLVRRAIELGLDYIAITDHYNRDFDDILPKYRVNSKELLYPLDIEGHIEDVARLNSLYGDKIYVGTGVECGYSKSSERAYLDTLDRTRFDVIINSIHVLDGEDIYYDIFYDGKKREVLFKRYLEAVLESVYSAYDYDIIGHIGYISRKAPYPNNLITYEEFAGEIDEILKAIIARDKCLECNSKSKNTPFNFLPGMSILERYYELGGRKISFGSDAHNPTRIADKYDIVASEARSIGFEGFTYYIKGVPHLCKF